MLWQEKWVTYPPSSYTLGFGYFFTINVKEKTAQENSFDFALVGLFMLISCHNENLKYRSASLGNWMLALFPKIHPSFQNTVI